MEAGHAVEPLVAIRGAEDDVHPPHVGHPAFPGRSPTVIAVRVVKALDVLVLEFVLGSARRRVALFPEGLDEDIPVAIGGELEKDILLLLEDDVTHQFQPLPVFGREVLFLDRLPG